MKNMSKATKKYDLMGFLIELCGLPYSRPVAKNMLSLKEGNHVTYQSSFDVTYQSSSDVTYQSSSLSR